MTETMYFADPDSLKQRFVLSRNASTDHVLEYSELDTWNLAQNASQTNKKNALSAKENFRSSAEEMQDHNNIKSSIPSSINFFITDIFMEAACEHGANRKTGTSSRRCLIDTGADVNMITLNSLEGLKCTVQPLSGCVHGAGGSAEVVALAKLNWHLKSRFSHAVDGCADPLDDFVVVDPTTPYSFDCVLGRPWIQKHIFVFIWICLKQRFLTRKACRTACKM